MKWYQLAYVFNYKETEGYMCRVPVFMARLICHLSRKTLDYNDDLSKC